MDRFLSRRSWLIFILLSGIASVWAGKNWLFIEAACPLLQDLLIYVCAGVGTFVCLLYALLTRNDSPINKIVSVGGLFAIILVVASVGGAILGSRPQMQAVYCNPNTSEKAALAGALRKTGKLDGAEDVARTCLEDISNTLLPEDGEEECSRELSLVLYEKAGQGIDVLPAEWSTNKETACKAIQNRLDEALSIAQTLDNDDLVASITERQTRRGEKCTVALASPVPTPTVQLELIRKQKTVTRTIIDIRVLESDQSLLGLQSVDFSLSVNNQPINFKLESRQADDPVCIIVVADNSGSIYGGRQDIHKAIQKLNDLRKPGDQFGLVLFSGRGEVRIEKYPSTDPLDPSVVKGTGQLTALWDGVLEGMVAAQSCTTDNRFLVVLTDGQDNDSRRLEGDNPTKAREIARQAIEQDVDICAVGITDKSDVTSLNLVSTGCGFYYAVDFESVVNQFIEIFGYVRDFYRIILPPDAIEEGDEVMLRVRQSGQVTIDFTP